VKIEIISVIIQYKFEVLINKNVSVDFSEPRKNYQHKKVGNLFQSLIRYIPITLCKPLHVRKNRSAGFSVRFTLKEKGMILAEIEVQVQE